MWIIWSHDEVRRIEEDEGVGAVWSPAKLTIVLQALQVPFTLPALLEENLLENIFTYSLSANEAEAREN